MAAKHYIEFNPNDIICSFKNSSDVVLDSFKFCFSTATPAETWGDVAAFTDDNVTYTRSNGAYSVTVTRAAGTAKKLQIIMREMILQADNEYTQTTLLLTANAATPANWDMNVTCIYNKTTGEILKQMKTDSSHGLLNKTTTAMNLCELTFNFDTLISSSVNMTTSNFT